MTITYKNDDSFFIGIYPPFVYHGMSIKNWFVNSGIAKFRFIRDLEVETEFSNIKQVHDLYPGIRTLSVVLNPWARMLRAFVSFNEIKTTGNTKYTFNIKSLELIDLNNFDTFIEQLANFPKDDQLWFNITTPLSSWTSYTDSDNNIINVDYIIRGEHLAEDFKPIQEYFCSDFPLTISPNIKYKKFYNKKSKNIISKLFEQDIDQFKYTF